MCISLLLTVVSIGEMDARKPLLLLFIGLYIVKYAEGEDKQCAYLDGVISRKLIDIWCIWYPYPHSYKKLILYSL